MTNADFFGAVGTSKSPLEHSARHAFRGLTKAYLNKLWTFMSMDVRRPTTENGLVEELVRDICSELSEEEIQDILAKRSCSQDLSSVHSDLMDAGVLQAVGNLLDHGDENEMHEEVGKIRTRGGGDGGRGGHSNGTSEPLALRGFVDPAPHMTREWAEQFLPQVPGVGVTKDCYWYMRWQTMYNNKPTPPYHFSKHWEEQTADSCLDALKVCLRAVWAAHLAQCPEARCPWHIDSLTGPAAGSRV